MRTGTPTSAASSAFPHRRHRLTTWLIAGITASAVGLVHVPQAQAQTQATGEPGARPAVTAAYDVATVTVPRWATGGRFGGGTIYYPTTGGPYGAIAVSPGYTGTQSSMAWYGPALAAEGFVVFTIDTNSIFDQPASRGTQLLAALDYLTGNSSVRDRVDASRLGVMGHSMGGGGTLEAAKTRPSLKAAIPLTGWNLDKTWREVRTPTLVIGAENDSIAPVATHSEPFYRNLPASLDKAYLELNNADHFAPNRSNPTIAKYTTAWLKFFLDNDTGYRSTLCPGPSPDARIEEYRSTCPF
ncbi:alpha/beta hydrolase family protein [Streptomyces gobiensis]|uniref:alpha/beta hydrolase family protein n=1 Tax=Streptomyces gobiensis TaxID=2875706 RepID=UPI001E352BF7|nr:dienelactone hydrolase family protein [Streptomyces gobiensis]UGY95125.1 dienelactone hydrolase family protein [Streptomyces gobiensis]